MPRKPTVQIPQLTKTQEEAFWSKIEKRPDGIWNWKAAKLKDGQGCVCINKKTYISHRVSWAIREREAGRSGDIPNGLFVLHRNDVTKEVCDVNPDNLWLGTSADNYRDCLIKGRAKINTPETRKLRRVRLQSGEQNKSAKLSWNQVCEIRALRQNKRLTLKELAELFLVSQSQIYRIIQNQLWKDSHT